MITIKIDFDYDDEFIEMFLRASQHEFTIVEEGTLTKDKVKLLLEEASKTKLFQNKERLGFLKIYSNDKLVGLSVPRVIDIKEYRAWCLPKDKVYHRMGMIFIDEPYRGKGIAKEAASLFKDSYPNILWTIDPKNIASKKVADHIGLVHTNSLYINGTAWKHRPWKHERVLEIWSN